MIYLPAAPSNDLIWDFSSLSTEDLVFLDLGIHSIDPFDSAIFQAHFLAVKTYADREVAPKNVVLAKIDQPFSQILKSSETLEQRYLEYLSDLSLEPSSFYFELLCANILSEYLHRLASVFPEDFTPFIEYKPCHLLTEATLLLCERRFEHFELIQEGSIPIRHKAKIGIALPQDHRYDPTSFVNILENQKTPFVCIPEELLNEHWDGLDQIIYDPNTIGEIGERMLLGFEAAGGEILRIK